VLDPVSTNMRSNRLRDLCERTAAPSPSVGRFAAQGVEMSMLAIIAGLCSVRCQGNTGSDRIPRFLQRLSRLPGHCTIRKSRIPPVR
jgi:hypothetical protein